MNKESLYDDDYRYTALADGLDARVRAALQPIFDEYVKFGFSPREISHLIQTTVFEIEHETLLDLMK